MDVSTRIFRLLKAVTEDKLESLSEFFELGGSALNDKLYEWEKAYGLDDEAERFDQSYQSKYDHSETRSESKPEHSSRYSSQFVEDLRLFGLEPPSSLAELKKARNREMKKFHPDKFLNEPEKLEVAKQIVQIYNGAFDRLKGQFPDS